MNDYMQQFTTNNSDTDVDKDDLSSTPRKRTRATPDQLSLLEKTFNVNPSPNNRVREQLSHELGMSERSIQIWFQNRRAKVKNIAKKSSMLHDETLKMQYYASSAAAAACQAAAYHQQKKQGGGGEKAQEIDIGDPVKTNPDLYYYYYYYYFNQQQQLQQQRHKQQSHNIYHPYGNNNSGQHHYNNNNHPPLPISLKSMPPPPPPPPATTNSTTGSLDDGSISPSTSDMTNQHSLWSKKQVYQHRTRAHTIGPTYYPPNMVHNQQQQRKLFDRGNSVEIAAYSSKMISPFDTIITEGNNNYNHILNNNTSPTTVQQQQQQFANISVQNNNHNSFLPFQSNQPSFFDGGGSHQQLAWTDLPFYEDPTLMITPNTSSMFNTNNNTSSTTTSTTTTPTALLQQPYYDHNQHHQQQKISAEALQIGTWKRMGFEPNDLTCQFDKQKKTFSWCIQDGLNRFKMEFNQASISKIQLSPLEGRAGWARLEMSITSSQIAFYMEVAPPDNWVQCRDYTEDKQASIITLHQLDGPALALKAELDLLKKENQYIASVTV